jgi:hypothetical protein
MTQTDYGHFIKDEHKSMKQLNSFNKCGVDLEEIKIFPKSYKTTSLTIFQLIYKSIFKTLIFF